MAIGNAAAARIEPYQSVIFDSSSTVREAARALLERDVPITAITNDILIAQMLANSSAITVLTIGGRVRTGSMTLFGPPGEEFLAGVKADQALIGAHAVTVDEPSEVAIEITRIKQLMADAIREKTSTMFQRRFSIAPMMERVD